MFNIESLKNIKPPKETTRVSYKIKNLKDFQTNTQKKCNIETEGKNMTRAYDEGKIKVICTCMIL